LRTLSCKKPIYYGGSSIVRDKTRLAWAENREARSTCLDNADNYDYAWSVQLITNDSRLEKILFPIFWGLMTLRYLPPFFLVVHSIDEMCCIHNTNIKEVNGNIKSEGLLDNRRMKQLNLGRILG